MTHTLPRFLKGCSNVFLVLQTRERSLKDWQWWGQGRAMSMEVLGFSAKLIVEKPKEVFIPEWSKAESADHISLGTLLRSIHQRRPSLSSGDKQEWTKGDCPCPLLLCTEVAAGRT